MSRNNKRTRKTDLKTLIEVIFIILDAATLGTIFVFIGHDAGGPFECTALNGLCSQKITYTGPIKLDSVVLGNSSGTGSTVTGSWTASINETILVIASYAQNFFPAKVNSISDTLGDSFALQIQEIQSTGPNDLEVWQAVTTASGADKVTVNWNVSTVNAYLVQAVSYLGASGIIQPTGSVGASVSSFSFTLTNLHAGDWMVGSVSRSASLGCGQISTPASFVKRSNFCAQNSGIGMFVETEADDNATALPNTISITYVPSWTGGATAGEAVFMELVAIDREPNLFVPSTVCQNSGETCRINWVNRVSGSNTLQTLVSGTEYCTGITTPVISPSGTFALEIFSTYSAVDTNVTGAVLQIKVYISTAAPSTTFGSGTCASGGIIVAPGKINFAVTGTNMQFSAQYYSTSVNAFAAPAVAGYYAWIDIIPQNFGAAGHMSMAQWGTAPNSQLSMVELK